MEWLSVCPDKLLASFDLYKVMRMDLRILFTSIHEVLDFRGKEFTINYFIEASVCLS